MSIRITATVIATFHPTLTLPIFKFYHELKWKITMMLLAYFFKQIFLNYYLKGLTVKQEDNQNEDEVFFRRNFVHYASWPPEGNRESLDET